MDVVKMNYPSNSNKSRDIAREEKKPKIEKVVKGKVIRKKKGLGRRISTALDLPENKGVIGYIFHDVAVPAFKELLYAMVTGGLSMTLFNTVRDRNRFGSPIRDRRDYDRYSRISIVNPPGSARDRVDDRYNYPKSQFDAITLVSKSDAEDVLSTLADLCETYGQATVADLYDAVGITKDYTSQQWGWRTMGNARIIPTRDGWMLDLPKEELLKYD